MEEQKSGKGTRRTHVGVLSAAGPSRLRHILTLRTVRNHARRGQESRQGRRHGKRSLSCRKGVKQRNRNISKLEDNKENANRKEKRRETEK